MPDVYLLRHGHVDYSRGNTITRDNPLTDLGLQMAERLAEACDRYELQAVYYSPMRRAFETAQPLLRRYPDLRTGERPAFEELSITDLGGFDGEMPGDDLLSWHEPHYVYGNERMWERVIDGWSALLDECKRRDLERVAVVAHAGSINIALRHALGQQPVRLRQCWFELTWTSISCVRVREENGARRSSIRFTNDGRHIVDINPDRDDPGLL